MAAVLDCRVTWQPRRSRRLRRFAAVRAGRNALDNTPVQSFFHTLKAELVQHRTYATHDEARRDLFADLDGCCSRHRLRSALDDRTPGQAERHAANVA